MKNYITDVETYLQEKGVSIVRSDSNELIIHCLFNGCDNDSKRGEAHLYISKTGEALYDCKKCGVQGNFITLRKHFGDDIPKPANSNTRRNFTQNTVEECALDLPDRIRAYLNGRGVTDSVISERKIGFGSFYNNNFITVPIALDNEISSTFLYLRKDPDNKDEKVPKNLSFPKGKGSVTLYGEFANENEDFIICEGIMDCLSLLSQGVKAVTSTGGCMTFKEEWVDERLLKAKRIFVAYDRDEPGDKGSEKVLKLLKRAGYKNLYKVNLPIEVGDKGDVNDYVSKLKLPVADLFSKYAKSYPELHDVSQFKEMSIDEVGDILSLTIKDDWENKIITFLCQLSAFTESNQFNVMFTSPSSSGKTYIALEVAKLFPQDSVIKLGHSSPTSFFHEGGHYDKETNTITNDLSRKIIIFLENQDQRLLHRLRAFISHDEKRLDYKMTDKNDKGGNRTKTVRLVGYSAFLFCTASFETDQQEKTRFIVLSPETTEGKVRAGIENVITKESNSTTYDKRLTGSVERQQLQKRIEQIRNEEIETINILADDAEYLRSLFFSKVGSIEVGSQREVKKIIDLAKSIALLNLWYRGLVNKSITVKRDDIDSAFALYDRVLLTQRYGVAPFIFKVYEEVIKPAYQNKNVNAFNAETFDGVTYQEILNKGRDTVGYKLNYNLLRQQVVPELEACGLIEKEFVGNKVLIHVTDHQSNGLSQSCEDVLVVNI